MDGTYIVGLTGRAGSGKDTVASVLGWDSYAFAKPLKDGLAAMGFPEPVRARKEARIAGFTFTWREAAQKLGTEWGRGLQSDIWLAMAERQRQQSRSEILVITDVRFHNEADWVRQHGALVHIRGRATPMDGPTATHASEHELPVVSGDLLIDNSGALPELFTQVNNLAQTLVILRRGW